MFCLPKEEKVRCCHCGNKDVHWLHTKVEHDCYSYADHYCLHHRISYKNKWELCNSNVGYCSPLPNDTVYTVYGSLWNAIHDCEQMCSANEDPIVKTTGTIESFSKEMSTGYVSVRGKDYRFVSTCFICLRTPRFPFAREKVEVVLKKIDGEYTVLTMYSIE